MNETLIECVPNFSEGSDRNKVRAIVDAMRVDGVSLLDWSLDSDHNRSVVTIAGPPQAVVEAAIRAAGKAAELIDLTAQRGVHPRIGATDVIPFVPVSGISLAQCAILARQAGLEIWKRQRPDPTVPFWNRFGRVSSRACASWCCGMQRVVPIWEARNCTPPPAPAPWEHANSSSPTTFTWTGAMSPLRVPSLRPCGPQMAAFWGLRPWVCWFREEPRFR
jgi:Formiminotransferase domain, N-terminal subdomain